MCRQARSDWAGLPADLLVMVLQILPQSTRVQASGVCKSWRAVGLRPRLWRHVECATQREGTRRSELRRLIFLSAWAATHAGATESMAISARVPSGACQAAALKAASQAALAAAASLLSLSLTSNRGFWAGGWLPRLTSLRHLRLCSKEGGLSLHGNLTALTQLTSIVLEASQAVTLSDHVRLPAGLLSCELSRIRDTLPPQLTQLSALQRLVVRQGEVSEGVLLIEHECLTRLTGLTCLALEHQGEDAWLPPPELAALRHLQCLSISGNDCSRWPLHGGDEVFSTVLASMPGLTSLDISDCELETLPGPLLTGPGGGVGPQLLRLLAHGNQFEAGPLGGWGDDGDGGQASVLHFPGSVRQLSIDWQVLRQALPAEGAPRGRAELPPCCRQLAVLGSEGGLMPSPIGALPRLPALLPDLRELILEPNVFEALWEERRGGRGSSAFQQVHGRWLPSRLPGSQPAQQQQRHSVLQQLRAAGVEVREVAAPEQLPAMLDEPAVAAAAVPAPAAAVEGQHSQH